MNYRIKIPELKDELIFEGGITNTKLNSKKKIVLDLCGGTGSWARPYLEAGYDVITITLPVFDVRESFLRGDGCIFSRQIKAVSLSRWIEKMSMASSPHLLARCFHSLALMQRNRAT